MPHTMKALCPHHETVHPAGILNVGLRPSPNSRDEMNEAWEVRQAAISDKEKIALLIEDNLRLRVRLGRTERQLRQRHETSASDQLDVGASPSQSTPSSRDQPSPIDFSVKGLADDLATTTLGSEKASRDETGGARRLETEPRNVHGYAQEDLSLLERAAKITHRSLMQVSTFHPGVWKDMTAFDAANAAAHTIDVLEVISLFRRGRLTTHQYHLFFMAFGVDVGLYLGPAGEQRLAVLRRSPAQIEVLNLSASMASHGSFTNGTMSVTADAEFTALRCEVAGIFQFAGQCCVNLDQYAQTFEQHPAVPRILFGMREAARKVERLYLASKRR